MARRDHGRRRRRRSRLRLQVEHGLDARHARVLPARADPPPLPPRRAHVQHGVRVQRALRAAALARRGRARQALAARPDARRPVAAAREPARALRVHVGAPGQEAAVHGRRVRAGARVGPRPPARLGAARAARARGHRTARPRPERPVPRRARALGRRRRPGGVRAGSRRTTPTTTCSRSRAATRAAARTVVCVANLSPVPRHDYRVGLPDGGSLGRAPRHRLAASTAVPTSATAGGSSPSRVHAHGQRCVGPARAAAAGRALARRRDRGEPAVDGADGRRRHRRRAPAAGRDGRRRHGDVHGLGTGGATSSTS